MKITIAVLLGCSALGLAACGSDRDEPGSGWKSADGRLDGALAFARCMREHGVDMPDPRVGGEGGGVAVTIDPEQMRSPGFKRAEKACGTPVGKGAKN